MIGWIQDNVDVGDDDDGEGDDDEKERGSDTVDHLQSTSQSSLIG